MIVVFNYLAAGFVFVGLLVGYGIQAATGTTGAGSVLAACVAFLSMAAIDGCYRAVNCKDSGLARFFLPWTGGQVMFIPLWLGAVIVLLYALSTNSG